MHVDPADLGGLERDQTAHHDLLTFRLRIVFWILGGGHWRSPRFRSFCRIKFSQLVGNLRCLAQTMF